MDYNLQIQKILVKVEEVDSPDDKINLLKEAIQLADAHNDVEWGYDLRLDLMDEENYTSHDDESFTAFAWLLDATDRHPDLFDEDEDLLWKYKWMVSSATRNSGISLQQVESIGEDFKMRLERNGYSLRPYYGLRYRFELFHMNNKEKAREYLDQRDKAQRDVIADCRACELDDNVMLEMTTGNTEKALTLGKDLFSGKLTCAHVPFITYASIVEHFSKAGNKERAYEFFVKAETDLEELAAESDTSQADNVARLIAFLADYDNEKAWEYFEQYIEWSLGCDDQSAFYVATQLLPLLKVDEKRKLRVSSLMPWYKENGLYETKDLYHYYHNQASSLAQRFDARNGNTFFTQQLKEAVNR